jgi:signal peptidase I
MDSFQSAIDYHSFWPPTPPAPILEAALDLWEQARGQHAIPITGNSMSPTIQDGDRVLVAHGPAGVRRGDVVVCWRGGRLIAHRVLRICHGSTGPTFITKGDGVSRLDPPVSPDEVVGRVLAVQRGDWYMPMDTAAWRIAGWLMAVSTLTWRELYRWGQRFKRRLLGSRSCGLGALARSGVAVLRTLGFRLLETAACRWRKR